MHCAVCQLNIWKVEQKSPEIVLKVFQFTKIAQSAMLLDRMHLGERKGIYHEKNFFMCWRFAYNVDAGIGGLRTGCPKRDFGYGSCGDERRRGTNGGNGGVLHYGGDGDSEYRSGI